MGDPVKVDVYGVIETKGSYEASVDLETFFKMEKSNDFFDRTLSARNNMELEGGTI